ncbi:hypothetical protein PS631_02128 [Pseudomonas fluorescens]|uniref:DUF4760 domain-containing protein n=1 Tax=Pseudomonas fluorescens TaxID=294 RepID=A0A5E6SAE7_PSEFL|nr:hypothetical protein PS631_02128 [Pseudomonas fluorescens]
MIEALATMSAIVTVLGLPFAIFLYWMQRTRAREDEDRAIYESLTSSYNEFLILILTNSDLKLLSPDEKIELTADQGERSRALFELLVSLFEQAYILSYSRKMSKHQIRRWAAWENYMRQWCSRDIFPIDSIVY